MALAPKKSVALQVRQRPSADVAPISGGSGSGATASPAGEVPLAVAPVPSVGQASVGAEGAPSEVVEQPVIEAIPLLMSERMELPLTLVAPTVVGATPPVEALPTQAEVGATATSQAQPDAATVMFAGAARSMPPVAQATAPEAGQTEGDMARGSPGIVAVVERTSGESPSALMSGGQPLARVG